MSRGDFWPLCGGGSFRGNLHRLWTKTFPISRTISRRRLSHCKVAGEEIIYKMKALQSMWWKEIHDQGSLIMICGNLFLSLGRCSGSAQGGAPSSECFDNVWQQLDQEISQVCQVLLLCQLMDSAADSQKSRNDRREKWQTERHSTGEQHFGMVFSWICWVSMWTATKWFGQTGP